MFEKRMTPAERWGVLGMAVLCLGLGVWVAALMFAHPDRVTPVARPIGWLAIASMAASAGLGVWLFAEGVKRRAHSRFGMAIAGIGGGVLGAALILASVEAAGLVVIGAVAVATVLHFLEEHQLATRQKLLEIEYRLAELQERIAGR